MKTTLRPTRPSIQDIIQRINVCATELTEIREDLKTITMEVQTQLGSMFVEQVLDKSVETAVEQEMENFNDQS